MTAPALSSPSSPGILLRSGEDARPAAGRVAVSRPALDEVRCGLRILAVAIGPRPVPGSWTTAAFVAEVDLVRSQLAPINDLGVLARCYQGEALRRFAPDDGGLRTTFATPVRVAYALRYAEIALGLRLPAWSLWLRPGATAGGPP